MNKTLVLTLLLFLSAGIVVAQADEIELTRQVIQTERQAIVAVNMGLTDSEGEKFWPLYRDYRNEVAKLGDRLMKVITTYADNYEDLPEETATWMVKEYLEIQKATAELRQNWAPRFREVLTPKQLARFYQIENKLDAIVNYDLAASIPLVR